MDTEFLRKAPYVGPRPFRRQDSYRFFGRDHEVKELADLICANQTVLLYSQSGAGKSSLINAGLVPALTNEGFEVLPIARVRGLLPKDINPASLGNPFVFDSLLSWSADNGTEARSLIDKTFVQFLKEKGGSKDSEGEPTLRVVVFDQFEELFSCYQDRWQDRKSFFQQLNDALKEEPRLLRVVFVMREDRIAQLDPYTRLLPDNLRTRFRLERLRRHAALSALLKPLEKTDYTFASGVAENLVDHLLIQHVQTVLGERVEVEGEFVEPVQLQVVAQSLWENLPPGLKVIRAEHLEGFGDPTQALADFYDKTLRLTARATGVKEGALRRWFEQGLITSAGTRDRLFRGKEETKGLVNRAVDELEDHHLIRAERRAAGLWYELNHDRFIEPIIQSNRSWLEARGYAEGTRKRFEVKASLWWKQRQEGQAANLLDEGELAEAERYLAAPDATELGISREFLALVHASQEALGADKRRKKEREEAQQKELQHAKVLAKEQRERAEDQARNTRVLRWLLVILMATSLWAAWSWWKAEELSDAFIAQENTEAEIERLHRQLNDNQLGIAEADELRRQIRERESDLNRANETVKKLSATKLSSPALSSGHESAPPSSDPVESDPMPEADHAAGQIEGDYNNLQAAYDRLLVRNRNLETQSRREIASLRSRLSEMQKQADAWKIASRASSLSQAEIERIRSSDTRQASKIFFHLAKSRKSLDRELPPLVESQLQALIMPEFVSGERVFDLAVSPDGRKIAIATVSNLKLFRADDGREIVSERLDPKDPIVGLTFGREIPNNNWLAAVHASGIARRWRIPDYISPGGSLPAGEENDFQELNKRRTPRTEPNALSRIHIAMSANGRNVAITPPDEHRSKKVSIYDAISRNREHKNIEAKRGYVSSLAFSPIEEKAAVGDTDGNLLLWAWKRGQKISLEESDGEGSEILDVVFGPGGDRLVSSYEDRSIKIWNVATSTLINTFFVSSAPKRLAIGPGGKKLAIAGADNEIRILSMPDGVEAKSWKHPAVVNGLAFLPDPLRLAVAAESGLQLYVVEVDDLMTLAQQKTAATKLPDDICQRHLGVSSCPDWRGMN